MLKLSAVTGAIVGLAAAAAAQQPSPSWQDLALRAQQNATVEQMTANSMIAALAAENAQLKAEIAKLQANDPPGDTKK